MNMNKKNGKPTEIFEREGQDGVTPIRRGRSTNRASTRKPTFYVTIQETSNLTNYDSFAGEDGEPVGGVGQGDFRFAFKTVVPERVVEFAKRVQRLNPDMYVAVWRDRYAIGPQSRKGTNFARPGVCTMWDPKYKYWTNGLNASSLLLETGEGKDERPRKKYSRKQIIEAIRYWKNVLRSMN